MLKLLFENNKNEKVKMDEKGNVVTVQPWPVSDKETVDHSWGRSGFDSLYK